jgi:hypothetical protein
MLHLDTIKLQLLLAIISTYLPFLTAGFFFPPAALGATGPSRSSISLALLILVLGLLGGRDGGIPPDSAVTGPGCGGCALVDLWIGGGIPRPEGGPPATEVGESGCAGLPMPEGGGIMPLAGLLGGAIDFGGGGVAAAGVAASAPPFLLTHRPRSLSK